MSKKQIFVSYKREDSKTANSIRQALRANGFNVWWDEELLAAERWEETIDKALVVSGVIVVLWSRRSIDSEWVKHEASIGKVGHILAHALVEPVKIPMPFQSVHAADLTEWDEKENHPEFVKLSNSIKRIFRRQKIGKWRRIAFFFAAAIVCFILGLGSSVVFESERKKTQENSEIKRQTSNTIEDRSKISPLPKGVGDTTIKDVVFRALLSDGKSKRIEFSNFDGPFGLQFKGEGKVTIVDDRLYVYLTNITFQKKPGLKHNPKLKWFRVDLGEATPDGWNTTRESEALKINEEFASDEKVFVLRDKLFSVDIRGIDVSKSWLVFTGIDPTAGRWYAHGREIELGNLRSLTSNSSRPPSSAAD